MHTHGPDCLEGPVSRERDWWQEAPPVRWHLVERVRRAIAAGDYDTPEKLELALQRMLERLQDKA